MQSSPTIWDFFCFLFFSQFCFFAVQHSVWPLSERTSFENNWKAVQTLWLAFALAQAAGNADFIVPFVVSLSALTRLKDWQGKVKGRSGRLKNVETRSGKCEVFTQVNYCMLYFQDLHILLFILITLAQKNTLVGSFCFFCS